MKAAILFVAAFFVASGCVSEQQGPPTVSDVGKETTLKAYPKIQPSQNYTDVTADEAATLIEKETVAIVDVRAAPYFERGHIPNALNIPEKEISEFDDMPRDATYLLYCGGNSESIRVGNALAERNFTRVYRIIDGYAAWRRAGYPRKTVPKGEN